MIYLQKKKLETLELDTNRQEFEDHLNDQSRTSPKFTRKFTNGIFYYMNRQMQYEGYEMSDEHLQSLKVEIERDSGLWYKLFGENEQVLQTYWNGGCTPAFAMGKFFHWSFVYKVKPVFYQPPMDD